MISSSQHGFTEDESYFTTISLFNKRVDEAADRDRNYTKCLDFSKTFGIWQTEKKLGMEGKVLWWLSVFSSDQM